MTAKALIKPLVYKVVRRAGRSYVVGDSVADVQAAIDRLGPGMLVTVGYWHEQGEDPSAVARRYQEALEVLGPSSPRNYLSVKAPALVSRDDDGLGLALLADVGQTAAVVGRLLHFDSHSVELVPRDMGLVDSLLGTLPNLRLGITLPGRWRRSLDDARWATERGLFVRVVKGQWADPGEPMRDPGEGVMQLVSALAGSHQIVAVATHDPMLLRNCLHILRESGTRAEVELLYGLPARQCVEIAAEHGVSVRTYLPFGEGFPPYMLSAVRRNPRMIRWVLSDLMSRPRAGTPD